jgi:hypothetical protein
VWRSQTTGLTVGIILWLAGSLPPATFVGHVWATPVALAVSALLLATALYGMRASWDDPRTN